MRRLLLALLLLALAAPAGAASAAGGSSAGPDKASWVARLRDARDGLSRARQRYDSAVTAYGKMRHRGKTRGEPREAIRNERAEAREALDAAEHHLDAVLESARRAGVPPGWLREALGDEDAPPASEPD